MGLFGKKKSKDGAEYADVETANENLPVAVATPVVVASAPPASKDPSAHIVSLPPPQQQQLQQHHSIPDAQHLIISREPSPLMPCMYCGRNARTRVTTYPNWVTWCLVGLLLFLFWPLFWLPVSFLRHGPEMICLGRRTSFNSRFYQCCCPCLWFLFGLTGCACFLDDATPGHVIILTVFSWLWIPRENRYIIATCATPKLASFNPAKIAASNTVSITTTYWRNMQTGRASKSCMSIITSTKTIFVRRIRLLSGVLHKRLFLGRCQNSKANAESMRLRYSGKDSTGTIFLFSNCVIINHTVACPGMLDILPEEAHLVSEWDCRSPFVPVQMHVSKKTHFWSIGKITM